MKTKKNLENCERNDTFFVSEAIQMTAYISSKATSQKEAAQHFLGSEEKEATHNSISNESNIQ